MERNIVKVLILQTQCLQVLYLKSPPGDVMTNELCGFDDGHRHSGSATTVGDFSIGQKIEKTWI